MDSFRPNSGALTQEVRDVQTGRGMEFDERVLPEGGGVISLFGVAVLIWSLVIAAAVFLF